jgi:alcohol dehydrogenase class IV
MNKICLPRYIVAGDDSLEDLRDELLKRGTRRVLLVTDANLFRAHQKRMEALLQGFESHVLSDVSEEPDFGYVEDRWQGLAQRPPDAIVAWGGGSVIDAAKALLFKLEKPEEKLEEVSPFVHYGIGEKIRLFVVPTTAGTGSDASFGIVLTRQDRQGRVKTPLGSYELVPYATYLEPELTLGLGPNATRATALDALTHALEAYIATGASEFTDALAEKTVELIYDSLPVAYSSGSDREARRKLQVAATMAGVALTNSGLGLAHCLGHALGSVFGTVHGSSVGVYLPYIVRYNSAQKQSVREKYTRLSERLGYSAMPAALSALYTKVGAAYNLAMLGISEADVRENLERLVEIAASDSEIVFNPVLPRREHIRDILLESIRGSPFA